MAKFNFIVNWALIGLYTNGCHPAQNSIYAFLLKCISLFSNFAVVFLSALQLIDYEGIETVAKVEQLPNSCLNFSKFICVAFYRNEIMNILNDLKQFWDLDRYGQEYKHKLEFYHKFSITFYKIYISLCFVTVSMLSLKPYIVKERSVPFPGYDFCNLETSPCFEMYWGFQAYHIMCQLYPVIMGFDGLFIAFLTYVYVEIELIKYGLDIVMRNVTKVGNEEETAMKELVVIIKHHDFVLNFIKKLRSIYFMVLFVKYWTTMGAMTFSLFMMTREGMPPKPDLLLKYGVYIINLMVQCGLYCLGGHILMDQVASVPNAIFHSDWWSHNIKLRKTIPFMLFRAQRPERLLIGKMYDLNLVTYIGLLRQVISIYTLLDKLA